MQRIGVFVCHCGTNIAATVDVKKVVEMAAKEPGVVHAEDYQYMCSEAGQAKIINAIHETLGQGGIIAEDLGYLTPEVKYPRSSAMMPP